MPRVRRTEYIIKVQPVPEKWQSAHGWQILKDFIRDQIDHQPGNVKPSRSERCTVCTIKDKEDAYKAYNALLYVRWDEKYLSVTLSEHEIIGNESIMAVLEQHNGDESNAKKRFESNTSRESTSVTRFQQRDSNDYDGRNARTSLYSGPFDLIPSNVSKFVRDPRVSMSPVLQFAAKQIIYSSAQSDGPEPFNALFSQLTLASPNEYGDNSMARSCQEHRRNESTSSIATSRSERKGPIIAKTPEAV